jgi:hypothetical protein
MTSEGMKLFKYDVPNQYTCRLFLLELNGEQDPLLGRLLTFEFYHAYTDMKSVATTMFSSYKDKDRVMKVVSQSEHHTALSYSWGQSMERHPLWLSTISCELDRSLRKSWDDDDSKMIVQDHEPDRNGYLMISTNLRNYLLEYRRRRLTQFLWIDAICIDQTNDTDKNNQIPLMRHYYEAAKSVHVWLGDATPMEQGVLRILPAIVGKLQASGDVGESLSLTMDEFLQQQDLPPADHNVWAALASILSRPWWDRLWVRFLVPTTCYPQTKFSNQTLQEVVMADRIPHENDDEFQYHKPTVEVLCNSVTVPWQHFDGLATALRNKDMSEWLMSKSSLPKSYDLHGLDAIREVRTCRESMSLAGWSVDLSAGLVSTRRRKATVPADMVFGMLAMLDATTIKTFDLKVSMSTQDVYVRFGKHYIRNEVLECLLNHVVTRERLMGLPSWCPDFASVEETVSIGTRWIGHHEVRREHEAQMPHAGYQRHGKWAIPTNRMFFVRGLANLVSGKSPLYHQYDTSNPRQITLMEDSNAIVASGVTIDTIIEIVDCNPALDLPDPLSQEGLLQTLQWDQECSELAKEQVLPGEMGLDVYARTITANRVAIRVDKNSDIVFDQAEQVDFAAAYCQFKEHMEATSKDEDNHVKKLRILPAVANAFNACLTAMSRRRRFFLTKTGRIGLGPSDTKVGDNLVVIFFCPTPYLLRRKDPNWQIVGETYVHGLMYGEGLDMLDSGDLQETQWIIE